MTDPPSTFSVATPTAWIDVIHTDRAADFVVETVEESRTTITVIWGQVRVRNISDQAKEERILTSCKRWTLRRIENLARSDGCHPTQ